MTKAPNIRKVLHVALAAALIVGGWGAVTADTVTTAQELVTGHTEWLQASSEYNSCMAGIAGILMNRVTWFNGRTLFSRPSGAGSWVYVTEHLNTNYPGDAGFDSETGIQRKDPSQEQLYRTGETFEVEVPTGQGEGKVWLVHEFFAIRPQVEDLDGLDPGGTEKVYVYAVQVAGKTYHDNTINKDYNFALVVDTCKFHNDRKKQTDKHDNRASSDEYQGDGATPPRYQHNPEGDAAPGSHRHNATSADIWVGGEPDAIDASQAPGHGGFNP